MNNTTKYNLTIENLHSAECVEINVHNSKIEDIKDTTLSLNCLDKNSIPPKKSKEIHELLDIMINNYTVDIPENYIMPDDFQQIIDNFVEDLMFASKLTIPLVNYYFNNCETEMNEERWVAVILVLADTENKFEISNKILYYLHAKDFNTTLYKINSTLPGWMINHMPNDTNNDSYYDINARVEESISFIKSYLECPYLNNIDLHKNEDEFFEDFYIEDTEIECPYLNNINKANEENSELDSEKISPEILNNQDTTTKKLVWFSSESLKNIATQIIDCKRTNPEKYDQLKIYVSSLEKEKPILEVKDYSIFDSVVEKAPNFCEVVKYFKGSFVLNQSRAQLEDSYLVTTPILLLGNPGIGKTYFAKTLAKLLNTSFYFMDANSITANWVLSGGSSQWKSGEAGNIFKFMNDSRTISPVVIFDEIDKLNSGKNYDTFSVFHQLLEPENSRTFKDEFLNIDFDASNIIYILTANDVNSIPDSLLSRMKVFDIKNPNKEDTRKIAQNIYSDVIGKSPLFNPTLNEKQLLLLENLSPRILKKLITESVFNQAADLIDQVNQELVISSDNYQDKKWGF